MRYSRVYLESIGYELAPVVVSTRELENRLTPFLAAHGFPPPRLDLLTGISERRWWEPNDRLSRGATAAAKNALAKSNVSAKDIGTVIYAGVCREQYEPATACAVADNLGMKPQTILDISNACLGVLNGIVQVANQIELGQTKAGLVVSCESAREINDATIRLLARRVRTLLHETARRQQQSSPGRGDRGLGSPRPGGGPSRCWIGRRRPTRRRPGELRRTCGRFFRAAMAVCSMWPATIFGSTGWFSCRGESFRATRWFTRG